MRPAGDTIRRVVERSALFQVTPDPPRDPQFANGTISWTAPQDSRSVTHYRIYANDERNLVRQVPLDQLFLQDNLTAARVFISAFNAAGKKESSKVLLKAAVAPVPTGVVALNGFYTVPLVAAHFTPDRSLGLTQNIVVVAACTINAPIITGGAFAAGDWLDLRIVQDAVNGGFVPTFDAIYHIGTMGIVGISLGTYTMIPLLFEGTFWNLRAQPSQEALL